MPATSHTNTPTHQSWRAMIERCCNTNATGYARYGGRGIRVCERWRRSFEAFREDMGERPSREHFIERVDNDGNYEPTNCRWATRTEQNRNSTHNVKVTHGGVTRCISEWAEATGIPAPTLYSRAARGMSPADILAPVDRNTVSYDGQALSLSEWSRHLGIPYNTLLKRFRAGWSPAAVLGLEPRRR
jgi:hypothetical protein